MTSDMCFVNDLAAVLEIEDGELSDQSVLPKDSIVVLAIINLMSHHFDITVDIEALLRCETVGDVRALVARVCRGA